MNPLIRIKQSIIESCSSFWKKYSHIHECIQYSLGMDRDRQSDFLFSWKFEQETEKEILGMSREELWRTLDGLKKLLSWGGKRDLEITQFAFFLFVLFLFKQFERYQEMAVEEK